MSESIDSPERPIPPPSGPSGPRFSTAVPPEAPPVQAVNPNARRALSGAETYNVVSDTIIGVNVRGRDNLIQFLAIVAGVVLGIGIGALVSPRDRISGAIFGGIAGLIGGLLLSGIALMIYRAVRHARGRHD